MAVLSGLPAWCAVLAASQAVLVLLLWLLQGRVAAGPPSWGWHLGALLPPAAVLVALGLTGLSGSDARSLAWALGLLALILRAVALHGRGRARPGLLATLGPLLALVVLYLLVDGLQRPDPGTAGPNLALAAALGLWLAAEVQLLVAGMIWQLRLMRRATRSAQRDTAAATLARGEAAAAVLGLTQALAQRDQWARQRQQMLDLLSQDIRQPLHQALATLHHARGLLETPAAPVPEEAVQRLDRAQRVLGDVHSVLDNTLAAAELLARTGALVREPVLLMHLVSQVLSDLSPVQRKQVALRWQHPLPPQAVLAPALVRLALRNLLLNALRHGGPAVRVQLRLSLQARPPAWRFEVCDDGPGMSASLCQALSLSAGEPPTGERGAAAQAPALRGLGLRLVRDVARAHGGQFTLAPGVPAGLCATLLLPQAAPPA